MPTIAPISNVTMEAAIATPAAAMPAVADGGTGSGRQPFESVLAQTGLSKTNAPAAPSAPSVSSASSLQALGRDLNFGRQEQKPERADNNTLPILNPLGAMSLAIPGMPLDSPAAPNRVTAPLTDTSQNPSTEASTTTSSSAIRSLAAAISQIGDGPATSGQPIVIDAQNSIAQADIAPMPKAESNESLATPVHAEQTKGAGQPSSEAPASDANSIGASSGPSLDTISMAATDPLLFAQGEQTKAAPQNSADANVISPGSPSQGPAKNDEAPSPANSSNVGLQNSSAGNGPGNSSTPPTLIPPSALFAGDPTAERSLLDALSRFGGAATVHSQATSIAPDVANILPPPASSPSATKTTETNPAATSNSGPAQNPATPASNSGSGAAANHSDNSSNSGGNTQKNSNSDAAAEAKAAGLASTSGDQSSHAPADAPAQSAGAAGTAAATAGSAATNSTGNSPDTGSASAAIFSRPQPLPAAMPQSLGDVVKASDLYQRVGGAEMHISMDTDLLGSIDVRAVVHQSTLTATIGVERADVQTLLANELPALQHSLSEQSLHINEISVMSGSVGARSDFSGNSQPQHQAAQPHFASGINSLREPIADSDSRETPLEALLWNGAEGRISIHV